MQLSLSEQLSIFMSNSKSWNNPTFLFMVFPAVNNTLEDFQAANVANAIVHALVLLEHF